jgi:hypothetical protein
MDRDGAVRFRMAKLCQRPSKPLPCVWPATVSRPVEVQAVWFLPGSGHSRIIQDSQKLAGIERGLNIHLNPAVWFRQWGLVGGGTVCLGG